MRARASGLAAGRPRRGTGAGAAAASAGVVSPPSASAGAAFAGAARAAAGTGATGVGSSASAMVWGSASGRTCTPMSKDSPGPGLSLVVGERGVAWPTSAAFSSSEMSLPAFADSPLRNTLRSTTFPRTVVLYSNWVSQVSSGKSRVISSSTRATPGVACLRSSAKL